MRASLRVRSCLGIALSVAGGLARGQTTLLLSTDASGVAGDFDSFTSSLSADGRYAAFESEATNFPDSGCPSGAACQRRIYFVDRPAGAIELVSRASASGGGAVGNGYSDEARVSRDGRYVVFHSHSDNLVSGDTNFREDVFLRDRLNQTTERLSLRHGGLLQHTTGTSFGGPSMSSDVRYIAFHTDATDLVTPPTTAGNKNVFVRDRTTQSTVLASRNWTGGEAMFGGDDADISDDGRYVVFDSYGSDLLPPGADTNGVGDLFVRDLVAGTNTRVSVSSTGAQGDAPSYTAAISGNGRYVVFESEATNFVSPPVAFGSLHVYRHDRDADGDGLFDEPGQIATILISIGLGASGPGNNESAEPRISADGRYVVFSSEASNLVANDTNNRQDVFVRDCVAGNTVRVSVAASGAQATRDSGEPWISENGAYVSFLSLATSLVPPVPANVIQVYARGPLTAAAPLTFCTSGTTTNGCTASISASAHPRVNHASPCQITVTGVEGQKSGIIFYGLDAAPQPWCSSGGGTSFLCVKTPTMRTGAQGSGGTAGVCNGALTLDWNAFQIANPSALGAPWLAGGTAYVQGWFRDPPACKTTNLSNAVELIYAP